MFRDGDAPLQQCSVSCGGRINVQGVGLGRQDRGGGGPNMSRNTVIKTEAEVRRHRGVRAVALRGWREQAGY